MSVLHVAAFTLLSLSAPEQPVEKDQMVYKTKTIIDFSELQIAGEIAKPEGSYISSRKDTKFKSLIRLRMDFRPELLTSMDAL